MKNNDPRAIQSLLEAEVAGESTSEQLAFDPSTGELRIVPAQQAPRDAIVVDSIARDGFFGQRARVYVSEDALRGLPLGKVHPGIAYGQDDDTVLQAFLGDPPARPVGQPLPCFALRLDNALDEQKAWRAFDRVRPREQDQPVLAMIARVEEDSCEVRAVVLRGKEVVLCEAQCIPPKSELYSRSRGLLETDVLARKSVAVVGVGSGGAPIAVELAKAGVGRFVLIDPDRLELCNVVRHVCGVSDLGRYKTRAVRDAILDKNPWARVDTHELDVNEDVDACASLLGDVDLVVAATDGTRSRFNVNQMALEAGVTALFGRALRRAAGGEVLRVRPGAGPCLACLSTDGLFRNSEEVSNREQAARDAPAYVSPGDLEATVQPGLSADIAPISNMIVRLALVELSRGSGAGIASLQDDLEADFYIWANRRELSYAGWNPMGFGFRDVSILRWYGARFERKHDCPVCGCLESRAATA